MASVSCGVQSPGLRRMRDLQDADGALRLQFHQEEEDVFGLAAADGQHAMRGNGLHRLAIVVVHLELFLLIDGIGGLAAGDDALVEEKLAERLAQVGIFADRFGDDVARAFERFVEVGDAFFFADEGGGEVSERQRGGLLRPKILGQRLQSLFARDGGLGAALGLVGQVEIFELAFVETAARCAPSARR